MKGFTLIETMIAVVVIGIAFLGLLTVVTGVFINAPRDEVMAVAVGLAKGEMERVSGLSFADVSNEPPANFSGNFSNYSFRVIMSAVPTDIAVDPSKSNYKQVEVRVTNVIIGDVSLKTIVTNN
ncbi:prepilin-type N-terminal cleavage/methylation domain-containing protein [Candidatus Omnitrophota bacterium]